MRQRGLLNPAEGRARGDGNGSGLPIVEVRLERHGREVSLERELGRGTTVTVVPPCC